MEIKILTSLPLSIFLIASCSYATDMESISHYIEDTSKLDTSLGKKVFLFDEKDFSLEIKDDQNKIVTRFKVSDVDFNYIGKFNEYWLYVIDIKCQYGKECMERKHITGHGNYDSSWRVNLTSEHYGFESYNNGNNLTIALNALKSICNHKEPEDKKKLHFIINEKDPERLNKSLFKAVTYGNLELVKNLLSTGADINYINESGETLLHCAFGNLKLSELLLYMGINVNKKSVNGITPLHLTVPYDPLESEGIASARLYLSYGAKTNIKDNNGETVIELSRILNNKKMYYLLTGTQLSPGTKKGNTHIISTKQTRTGTDYTIECKNGKWVGIGKDKAGVYTNGYFFSSYSFEETTNHACNH